jgi:hypothetical protein
MVLDGGLVMLGLRVEEVTVARASSASTPAIRVIYIGELTPNLTGVRPGQSPEQAFYVTFS